MKFSGPLCKKIYFKIHECGNIIVSACQGEITKELLVVWDTKPILTWTVVSCQNAKLRRGKYKMLYILGSTLVSILYIQYCCPLQPN